LGKNIALYNNPPAIYQWNHSPSFIRPSLSSNNLAILQPSLSVPTIQAVKGRSRGLAGGSYNRYDLTEPEDGSSLPRRFRPPDSVRAGGRRPSKFPVQVRFFLTLPLPFHQKKGRTALF